MNITELNQYDASVPAIVDQVTDLNAAGLNPPVQALSNRTKFLSGVVTAIQAILASLKGGAFLDVGTVTGTVASGLHTHPEATNDVSGFMSAATMKLFNVNSLTPNGYQKLPGGLIIQWGTQVVSGIGSDTQVTLTFAIPFPNGVLRVVPVLDNSGASTTSDYAIHHVSSTSTQTTELIQKMGADPNTSPSSVGYIAIGF